MSFIKKFPSNTAFAFFLGIDLQLFSLALNKKPWVFGDNVFKHYLSLLILTYSLLIPPINFTAYLQQHTKRSATILIKIYYFGIFVSLYKSSTQKISFNEL